jgi:hypothetical protein
MSYHQVAFEIVGPNAGKSIVLGDHVFKEGVMVWEGNDVQLAGMKKYLARTHNAHIQGSGELDQAKTKFEEVKKAPPTRLPRRPLSAAEERLAKLAAPAHQQNPVDAGADRKPVPEEDDEGSEPMTLADALQALDAEKDEHWTEAGLPAVAAVAELMKRDVKRAEINEAAPDFNREAARSMNELG